MPFVIDILYKQLALTEEEINSLNAALPSIKIVLDAVDAHMDDIDAIDQWVDDNQALIKQLLTDWRVIGPNMSLDISDRWVDVFGLMAAWKDVKANIASNPAAIQNLTVLYNNLVPVVNEAIAHWPTIKPAMKTVLAASHRRNMPMVEVITQLAKTMMHIKADRDNGSAF